MKDSSERIACKFSGADLDTIIQVLINYPLAKKFAKNVLSLFDKFEASSYNNEFEKQYKVYLVKYISNFILTDNSVSKEELLRKLDVSGRYNKECTDLLDVLKEIEVSQADLDMIDVKISTELRYSVAARDVENMRNLAEQFMTEEYDNIGNILDEITLVTGRVNQQMKTAGESLTVSQGTDYSSPSFLNVIKKARAKATDPTTYIKTGIRGLNEMLNGGFEKKRCYLICGMAKGFKSGSLLNFAVQAKKYNKLKAKDPTKHPCILYLSMENTEEETNERIFTYCFGNNFVKKDILNYTDEQVAQMMRQQHIYTPDDETSPKLVVKFRKDHSISTDDIYTMLDDMEKEGDECVMLIFDYIERINPSPLTIRRQDENRDILGKVVNDLTMIAKERDIPVLSAAQMNRESFIKVQDAKTLQDKINATNSIGIGQVGESLKIVKNCDVAILVNRISEEHYDENTGDLEWSDRYWTFNFLCARNYTPKITKFSMRFLDGNDLRVVEDINETVSHAIITNEASVKSQLENNPRFKDGVTRRNVKSSSSITVPTKSLNPDNTSRNATIAASVAGAIMKDF